jgi:hypothetical protein
MIILAGCERRTLYTIGYLPVAKTAGTGNTDPLMYICRKKSPYYLSFHECFSSSHLSVPEKRSVELVGDPETVPTFLNVCGALSANQLYGPCFFAPLSGRLSVEGYHRQISGHFSTSPAFALH